MFFLSFQIHLCDLSTSDEKKEKKKGFPSKIENVQKNSSSPTVENGDQKKSSTSKASKRKKKTLTANDVKKDDDASVSNDDDLKNNDEANSSTSNEETEIRTLLLHFGMSGCFKFTSGNFYLWNTVILKNFDKKL